MTRFQVRVMSKYAPYAFRRERAGCIPCRLWHFCSLTRLLNMTAPPGASTRDQEWRDTSLVIQVFGIL